jgi:hypothetical protein
MTSPISRVQAAPDKLAIEGACRACTVRWPIKDGAPVVYLCPLHAQAEALREALHALLARYDKVGGPLAVGRAVDEARALLATLDASWIELVARRTGKSDLVSLT